MNQKQDISDYGKGYQIDADKIDHVGDKNYYLPASTPSLRWEHQPPSIEHWQGREKELAQLNDWLAQETNRLMIIHGVGGFGKSTLAAKIHREKPGFADAFWADMSRRLTFAELARRVLQQFHSLPQKQVEEIEEKLLADVLLNCLRKERYLLVIDNLETLLHPSGEWQDVFYEQFFLRWLECGSKSVLLVTTQERPKLPEIKPRWLKLLGLKSSEGAALLQALGIQGTQPELETFSEAVNGCPLTLKLVAGLLNMEEGENPPLSRLSKYGKALRVKGLHRRRKISTKKILKISLRRLSEKLRRLLFNLSVYRLPFDVAAAVAQLPGEEVAEGDLKELERRSLLQMQRDGGGELRFQFQPMILNYARRKAEDLTAAHQQAIGYYDSCKKGKEIWQTLDDLTEWLELFHHQCELREYVLALIIVEFCANFLARRGYPNKLIELFQQSLVIYREVGDRAGEGGSLCNLGTAHSSLGQYSEAISYYQQALAVLQPIGHRKFTANSLAGLGSAYSFLGKYREAIAFYQQSLAIEREIGDRVGEANSLNGLGYAYNSLGKYREALAFHQQSLAIFRAIGNRAGEASSLGYLGITYDSLGQYRKALVFHQQSLAIEQEIGNRPGEAAGLNNIGGIYSSLGQYREAIAFYQQSLAIKREIGDRGGEGGSLCNLGSASNSLGQYSEAISYYQQALAILLPIGYRRFAGNSLAGLGNTSYYLGQYREAISFYEQSLAIQREIGNRSGEANSLNGLGSAFAKLDRKWEAVQTYQKARDLYQAMGLEHKVQECDTAIQKISMVVAAEPIMAPVLQPTPRRRRRRTLLQRIRRWLQSLWRLLRILFRRR